jgi:C2 domain
MTDSVSQYKIRPGPDPKRVEETTWMTKDQINTECKKESINWVDVGAGRLGRLFVEILYCDGLPNLDVGGFAGNKTDAFVSVVFEDAVVQTDVVDDTLSPRWLPWTKRAFIFHILHSSSQLFLGVFDYDAGFNPADDHDLIGRVSVDLSNLQKDTVYTLNYTLYPTARMSARDAKGNITIRVRLEIEDERKLLLSAIEPPPHIYVNVKTRKEFRVVRYTCTGKYNMEKYSMKIINAYVLEYLARIHFQILLLM